jgi:putative membrane protein
VNHFGTDIGNVGIGIVILLAALLIGAYVFSKLTTFNDWEEIRKGNEAAGMYMGSKLLGLGIIVAMVSYSSHDWEAMLVWSGVGIVLLCAVYIVFDFLTPKLNVNEEIAKGNKAVAQLLRAVILGSSIVIGTFLM